MASDPRKLKPSELCRLLNSTPIGEVLSDRQLHRHRMRAGNRIGDGKHSASGTGGRIGDGKERSVEAAGSLPSLCFQLVHQLRLLVGGKRGFLNELGKVR